VRVRSNRLGLLEYTMEDILTFPHGMVGFPEYKQFIVHKDADLEPFMWLVSLESADLSFFVVDPFLFFPDYEISLDKVRCLLNSDAELALIRVYVIVTIHEDFIRSSANLLGPVVINSQTRKGRQLVLDDPRYTTRHPLFSKLLDDIARAETG
jgi:flagellar assembly factor FliW